MLNLKTPKPKPATPKPQSKLAGDFVLPAIEEVRKKKQQ